MFLIDFVKFAYRCACRYVVPDDVSDSEGLTKAYNSDTNVYVNGDTLHIAGTKTLKEWRQNIVYGLIPLLEWRSIDANKHDRYHDAIKALSANPNIKHLVGHSLGGLVILELHKTHPQYTGRVYGTPYIDPMARDRMKDFLLEYKKTRDEYVKSGKLNDGNYWISDTWLNVFEKLLGLDALTGMSNSGIERYRNVGDPFTLFDNSANTLVQSHPFRYLTLTHDYHELAKDNFS